MEVALWRLAETASRRGSLRDPLHSFARVNPAPRPIVAAGDRLSLLQASYEHVAWITGSDERSSAPARRRAPLRSDGAAVKGARGGGDQRGGGLRGSASAQGVRGAVADVPKVMSRLTLRIAQDRGGVIGPNVSAAGVLDTVWGVLKALDGAVAVGLDLRDDGREVVRSPEPAPSG
jgi:hypothetical protein